MPSADDAFEEHEHDRCAIRLGLPPLGAMFTPTGRYARGRRDRGRPNASSE